MKAALGALVLVAALCSARAFADLAAPADEEVCFSPDEPCAEKLLKFIDGAKTSLDVAIFDVNLGELVDKLIEKAKKIQVRVVVDRKQAKGKHSAVMKLAAAGVDLRFGHQRGTGIMHNKFVIVDGKALETGSFNYTNHASHWNNENQIYLSSAKIVERYKKRFEQIWKQADPPLRVGP
jgi:phosphatidylserine/phosphatidylglycerophosphate/cardiolipin synthase-like enzyme